MATVSLAPTRAAPLAVTRRMRRLDWAFAVFFGGYVLLALLHLGTGAVSAGADFSPALHQRLHGLGLFPTITGRIAEAMADASHNRLSGGQLALDYAFVVLNLAPAALVLWLRPRHRAARLLAVATVGTAAIFNLQAYTVFEALERSTVDRLIQGSFLLASALAYVGALLLFPDGRLPVRGASWPARLALFLPLGALAVVAALRARGLTAALAVIVVFGVVTPAVGVVAQAYRARRAALPVERQQSRLLFWALLPPLIGSFAVLASGIASSALPAYEGRMVVEVPVGFFRVFQALFAMIPIALFFGIVRFRLWNIERVVSRALAYGALAGLVGIVYVTVVVGLGEAVGARDGNVLLSIVATGVVAVGFAPARERLQFLANRLVYGQRATPYEVLSTLTERVGEGLDADEALPLLAELVARGTSARTVVVWLVVGDRARPAASWPPDLPRPEPCRLGADGLAALGHPTGTAPVRHGGELLGAITVRKPGTEQLEPAEQDLLGDVAAQTGLVLRNVRLTTELLDRLGQLQASRQRLVTAQDEARRRLERNLHDGAQQQLVALKVKLALARRLAESGKPVADLLVQLGEETGDAIDNLRDLARGIYPPLLADAGLAAALRNQAAKAPQPVDVRADGLDRYHQDVEAAVYFCCLEALQNIAKYAEAETVTVVVQQAGGELAFEVCDDGIGFDPSCTARGAGLQNMADRLDALGGAFEIDSRPGGGTILRGRVPARSRPVAQAAQR